MIPTRFQMIRGKSYSRKHGPHSLQMYFRSDVYVVKYVPSLWAFTTYGDASDKLLQMMEELQYVR